MTRKAIVMGATSGIGMHVALQLAQRGWQVGIAGRRADRLEEVKRLSDDALSHSSTPHQGSIVCYKQIDVTSDCAPQLFCQLIDQLGGMDLYFHSSGIGWQNTTLNTEKELATINTNAVGFVRMVDAAFNWFASRSPHQRGHIACITSIAGTKGLGAAPAYSASKRFQTHYLECLSQQAHIRHLPIRVTDIRPGFVRTQLIADSNYPLQLDASKVATSIVNAVERGTRLKIIDWRYALLVSLWRLIPRWIWERMNVK